jgi:YggT family protein
MLISIIGIVLMLLTVLWWIIIVQAVLSWLVAFNVINTHSDFVRGLLNALDRITAPLYRPIRRILPDFGGIDFSPIVILLIIGAIDMLLRGLARDLILSGY